MPLSSTDACSVVVDLGTTTIAAALVDGATGSILASGSRLNPQRDMGLDVVSRLAVAETADGQARLKVVVNLTLEELVLDLCRQAAVATAQLGRIWVAGNTVMQELLCGAPTDTLRRPPFRPRETSGRTMASSELGWQLDLPLMLFPQPGGFVGGDLVAFLHGQGLASSHPPVTGPVLFLDLGTNAEIALLHADRLLATSAAAGPAFEAGNLSCGMLAQSGAIAGMTIDADRPQLRVIGGGAPVGLCGSGAISALAALLRAGVVAPSGQLLPADEIPSNLANYCQGTGRETAFLLYRAAARTIALTQEDIRQLQLAIAAVRAGIEVLTQRAGLASADGVEVVVTGAFGASLQPADLETIGLLPSGTASRCRFVADGALAGLCLVSRDPSGAAAVECLAQQLQVIPLSGTPRFEELFISHLTFPT